MIIRRFIANNWCQHTSIDWELGPGLTGIVGPVGAGKTNALFGIYYALTGDRTRNAGDIASNIKQHSENRSFVRVEFELNDQQYVIERGLRPSSRMLKLPNGETLTGANQIANYLETVLGVTKEVFDSFVFVDQNQTAALIQKRPAERAALMEELCRTHVARIARDALVRRQSAVQALVADAPAPSVVEQLRVQLEQAQGVEETAREHAALMRSNCPSAEELDLQSRLAEQYVEWQLRVKLREEMRAEIEAGRGQLKEAIDRYNVSVRELKSLDAAVADFEAGANKALQLAAEAEQRLKEYTRNVELRRSLVSARAVVAEFGDKAAIEKQIEAVEKQLADTVDARRAAILEHQAIDKRLSLLAKGQCPTCGASFETAEEERFALEADAAKLEATLHGIDTQPLADQLKSLHSVLSRVVRAEEVLRTFSLAGSIDETLDVPLMEARVRKADIVKAELKTLRQDLANQTSRTASRKAHVESLKAELTRNKMKLESANSWLTECAPEESAMKNAAGVLRRWREVVDTAAAAELAHARAAAELQSVREAYAEASLRYKRAVSLSQWAAVLTRASDHLHWDAVPKLVYQKAMQSLESLTNEALREFEAPFVLRVADDLKLEAVFRDSSRRLQPAERLSGGQKVMLSMALRVAVYRRFASDLGLLVLDEPTSGMNEPLVLALGGLLAKLGDEFRNRQAQVLVVTHDQRLASFFQDVVEVQT